MIVQRRILTVSISFRRLSKITLVSQLLPVSSAGPPPRLVHSQVAHYSVRSSKHEISS
jgi:hypothetical protein